VQLVREADTDIPHALGTKLITVGTDIGAQVAEAQVGSSKRHFYGKMNDARRLSREIGYWLKVVLAADCVPRDVLAPYLDEAHSLHKTLTNLCVAAKQEMEKEKTR